VTELVIHDARAGRGRRGYVRRQKDVTALGQRVRADRGVGGGRLLARVNPHVAEVVAEPRLGGEARRRRERYAARDPIERRRAHGGRTRPAQRGLCGRLGVASGVVLGRSFTEQAEVDRRALRLREQVELELLEHRRHRADELVAVRLERLLQILADELDVDEVGIGLDRLQLLRDLAGDRIPPAERPQEADDNLARQLVLGGQAIDAHVDRDVDDALQRNDLLRQLELLQLVERVAHVVDDALQRGLGLALESPDRIVEDLLPVEILEAIVELYRPAQQDA